MASLDIQGVSFGYGNKIALSNLSVSIHAGETVILLGPNGAGKTTLFSLICGLFAANTGQILINGQPLHRRSNALGPLGIVFQSQTLDLDLSIEQNLLYFCALHGIGRKMARLRIAKALEPMALFDRRHEKIRALNGGHRRRVEIARATLHQPSILLLDEPTVGLDIPTRSKLIETIHQLPETHNCAILWATHLIDEIYDEDRVLMLNNGQLMLDGKAAALLESQQQDDLGSLMNQLIDQ